MWEDEINFSQYREAGNWLFEGDDGWYKCPYGYVIAGFLTSETLCSNMHCIEDMKCVSPSIEPYIVDQICYTKDIRSVWDQEGTQECENGYFLSGIYACTNNQGEGELDCWYLWHCCKYEMSSGDTLQLEPASFPSPEKDWNSCQASAGWCQVSDGSYITGFWRHAGSNGGEHEFHRLDKAKNRKLYDECSISSISHPQQFITKDLDTFSNLVYSNNAFETRRTTTMSSAATITKESTFTYSSGMQIGLSIAFGFDVGISRGPLSGGVSFEMLLEASMFSEFEISKTLTETISQSTPAIEYDCPARTSCIRSRILYAAPEQEIDIEIKLICDVVGEKTIIGKYIAKGGTEIEIVDSTMPMDCQYYTNDYYDRNNGKLPNCWNCNDNQKCNTCTDGKVELDDGQCYNDDVCLECGGTVQTVTAYGDGIGKFCVDEDINTVQCQTFINSDTTR